LRVVFRFKYGALEQHRLNAAPTPTLLHKANCNFFFSCEKGFERFSYEGLC
jgi:hypothetical protein